VPNPSARTTSKPLLLRNESGRLILPEEIAEKIHNFELTEENTLITIRGPCPLIPKSSKGTYPPIYADNMPGIYHSALKNGTRELLLVHSGTSIHVFEGWNAESSTSAGWSTLIGPASTNPLVEMDLPHYEVSFPTQFETTPLGVVIVPQSETRAVFYDGYCAAPLGYEVAPTPPHAHGPASLPSGSDTKILSTANDEGYCVDASGKTGGDRYILIDEMGKGRLGHTESVSATSNDGSTTTEYFGQLLPGTYQGAVQWIDRWGNFSALSGRSNEIRFEAERTNAKGDTPDCLMKQVMWSGVDPGPARTIGRILCRTRDVLHDGDTKLYIMPGNVGAGVFGAFATLPDNMSTRMMDNIPDAWLIVPPLEVMPVPIFKLCRLAFGRLWIANSPGDPGLVVPSLPGRYGTFLHDTQIYPDPSGGEITGLWSSDSGLLVFTATTTFIITPNSDGDGWVVQPLHRSVGCVAPSSLATLDDGRVVWLGREGFYQFGSEGIEFIGIDILPSTRRINRVRAKQSVATYAPKSKEYRCWVPMDASKDNSLCFIYDGAGWRQRKRTPVQAVCTTQDHRQYVLATGKQRIPGEPVPVYEVGKKGESEQVGIEYPADIGVWVLDREVQSFQPLIVDSETETDRTYRSVLETSWITWTTSQNRKTLKTLYFNFRETRKGTATIKVYRDWRMTDPIYTDTTKATLYTPEDIPPLWGEYSWDSSKEPNKYSRRRPYWKRVDVDVPSCEVYKIVIDVFTESPDDRCEFIGMMIDEEPKLGGFGTRVP